MKLTDSDIAALQEIVGKENVILDNEALEDYCHDEIPSLYFQPDAVVKPENTEQVSKIMALASERKFPVTPRGAGSGLSGGAVAVEGGIVLSLEKFNRILEIDQENMMAVVEPGVLTGHLQKEVEAVGLFIRWILRAWTAAASAAILLPMLEGRRLSNTESPATTLQE